RPKKQQGGSLQAGASLRHGPGETGAVGIVGQYPPVPEGQHVGRAGPAGPVGGLVGQGQGLLLVGNGDVGAGGAQGRQAPHGGGEAGGADVEGQVAGIAAGGGKGGVVHGRGAAVGHRRAQQRAEHGGRRNGRALVRDARVPYRTFLTPGHRAPPPPPTGRVNRPRRFIQARTRRSSRRTWRVHHISRWDTGTTRMVYSPRRLAPRMSVKSWSPRTAVSAGFTPSRSMARRKARRRGLAAQGTEGMSSCRATASTRRLRALDTMHGSMPASRSQI